MATALDSPPPDAEGEEDEDVVEEIAGLDIDADSLAAGEGGVEARGFLGGGASTCPAGAQVLSESSGTTMADPSK